MSMAISMVSFWVLALALSICLMIIAVLYRK
jgi:hypothetical protein